ncbi:MAG TPA: IS66 family transposase [Polyangiales bacterium]
MPEDEDLDALEAQLDPAVRYIVRLLRTHLKQRDAELARLTEQVAQFQRMLFGKRSEKLPSIDSEVRRAVQADELTVEGAPMPREEPALGHQRRRVARKKSEPKRASKRALRKGLPVVHERVEIAATQLPEGYALEDFRELSDGETIERIEHVREHLVVVQYALQTLASKDGEHIVKALAPASVIEGGHYGPGVYAHVITSKCDDSLPLYRIERAMQRDGCSIARSTLCSFFHRGAELLLPIYEGILKAAKHDLYLHADETRLPVQSKGKCLQGWIWGLMSKRAIAYTFDATRKGAVAKALLQDTKGFLVIDGYAGYNGVTVDDDESSRTRVGCWAHARRKFFEALRTAPAAKEALELIVELYRIESHAAELDILGSEAHLALRDLDSRAVLTRLEAWLDNHSGQHPPKSAMGTAVGYAIKQRAALRVFLSDPKLPLDNNYAERGLRIFALGRKNFLFAGHVEGAQNLAVLQSVVSTCRLHGVNPYEYIKDLLLRMQTHPAVRVDELMPWCWKPPPGADAHA